MCEACRKKLEANVFEAIDAPDDLSTPYKINLGDTFFGRLTSSDFDFVGLNVVAGETYEIALTRIGADAIEDPFTALLSDSGSLLTSDDDGGPGLSSLMVYTATYTGVVYVVADTFTSQENGTYAIAVTAGTPPAPPPVGTFSEMADYLTDGHWQESGETRHVFDTSSSNVITVDITNLGADGQQLARWAFEAWKMVTFQRITPGLLPRSPFMTKAGSTPLTSALTM